MSWRLVFLVNLPVAAIAFVYAVRLLRETRSDQASPDPLGGLLLMVAIGLLASLARQGTR